MRDLTYITTISVLWGFTEKSDFRMGVMKKPIYRGDCLKRGLAQFADLRGGLTKKRGMMFLRWG